MVDPKKVRPSPEKEDEGEKEEEMEKGEEKGKRNKTPEGGGKR